MQKKGYSTKLFFVNFGYRSKRFWTFADHWDRVFWNVPQLQGRHQHDATLTATVGAGTYTYEKSGVTFANSQYYAIAVKMTKQYAMAANATDEGNGNSCNSSLKTEK